MKKKAELVFSKRIVLEDGAVIEIKVWSIPVNKYKPHGFKYSLVYLENGVRIIGYDNSEQKGDHKHFLNKETEYIFKDIQQLFIDFEADYRRYRNENQKS